MDRPYSAPFMRHLWRSFAALFLFSLSTVLYMYSEKRIDDANKRRIISFLLADELRQSSDDLTRMIRTYAATGNIIYKRHYQEILNIRNGNEPYPLNYQNIYWDLVDLDDRRPRPFTSHMLPLIERMRQAGFTSEEFGKLQEAKNNSDTLTQTEFAAMKLIEASGTPQEKALQREKAVEILHDEAYHRAKASIMRPIDQFYTLMNTRTTKAVHTAEVIAWVLRVVFVGVGFFFLFTLWRLHQSLYRTLGGNVDDVHMHIKRIGKGNFSIPITVSSGDENSVLGWLRETQLRLEELIANNERLRQLYSALSQCNQAIVRSSDETELFPIICRDAVEYGGMKMGWIGIVDESIRHLAVVTSYGEGTEYLEDIAISADPTDPTSQGPTGRALHTGKPVWCQDFQHDPMTALWHEKAHKFGWGSSAALPLYRDGNVVGVFTLYTEKTYAFDAPAQKLLEEMATDISYALESFERDIAREKAENTLTETNNLLFSIINTSPVRIFWKDSHLNYLGCNQVFANDAGENDPKDVIGKNDTQLCWREQAKLYQEDDRRVMESGIPKLFFEESQTTPQGDTIWLSTSKAPLYNKNREIVGVVGLYEEITARKNTENALRESQERLQSIIANEPECVILLDTQGNLIEMNPAGLAMLEADTPEEAKTYKLLKFLLPQWRSEFVDLHRRVMHGDKGYLEFEITGIKGTHRWLEINAVPMHDEEGNVTMLLGIIRDVTQRKESERQIHYLANFDGLTGLPNRTQLDLRIKDLISLAKRNNREITVMFLDLDHFKDINDSLGHSIGDALLVQAAHRLQSILREEDTLARLGGDEFMILLPNIGMSGASQVGLKLLEAFSKPFHIETHELSIGSSIGIALYPNDGKDFETLYKNADTAMYKAKQGGRNNYCFFTEEMQKSSMRNLELSNALRHALERSQLELHYQPQFSAETKTIIGAEALLRWNHPEFGNVSPAEFISIAEENGTILPIGEWVLGTAARQAREWMDQGMSPLIIAVNLSAVQFRSPNLSVIVADILHESGLPPEYLELELTESVAMHDPQRAISVMNDLHEKGIRMSIDDFGTGYSSLSYLKKFNIYKLKIDQSFVRDIHVDPEDKAIVGTIISMAKSLGLRTIAEGVETTEQLDYLHQQGCDEIQGYYYAKPLRADDFARFRLEYQSL
ncbi:MAG: EAL domain-containing protein [Sulfuricurvum sp.]|nr:EAL domain-containing protein [Sulfuricurvum sp.]